MSRFDTGQPDVASAMPAPIRKKRVECWPAPRHKGGSFQPETPMPFRIRGLAAAQFSSLFALDDAELAERSMRRVAVDAPHSAPCRISLEDAEPGERVLLLPFAHQPTHSPYRASGPIYVREGKCETFDRIDELPPVFAGRLLAVRAYDADGMMTGAEVVEGDPRPLFDRFFADRAVDVLHVHYARRGCFACCVERA
jgi:hypothetical protein